jgi:transcriptional regulator with XRE-family HTH domain
MARKIRNYSLVGRKIAALGVRQVDLAKVLRVSQQTISKKMRGEVVTTVRDLRTLAKKFKKPLCFFVMEDGDCAKARSA